MLDNFSETQNKLGSRRAPSYFSAKPLENLGRGKWLDNVGEVLSYLDRHHTKKENGTNINARSMGTTISLLKQAQGLITNAEARISKQELRIKELERLTTTDELTGITNRRGFMREFDREIDRVNRDKSQGGLLIMIDLDNFKSINDTHGHDAGDAALKLVSSALANDIRTMDIAARMGGDEFVVLFVNTTRKQALERAQFIIKTLNNLAFVWNGNEIPVRASLGLKEYGKGASTEDIFSAADASMYENKRQTKSAPIRQDNKRM